jgi:hypothetical protein
MKFLTALIAATFLAACGTKSTDEEKVRALIASVEAAAEARDTSDVLELVAPDYSDAEGLDKAQLQNFLRGYFLSHPKIELLVDIQSLEFPAAGLAHARIGVASVALDQAGASDSATLEVEFRAVDGQWMVSRADRQAR